MPLYSKDDFTGALRRLAAQRRARRRWGRWRLDVASYHLDYVHDDGACWYWIDLLVLQDAARVVDILGQVAPKTWCSAADLGDLVHAIDAIFGMQDGFGTGVSIDAATHLRRLYGDAEGGR